MIEQAKVTHKKCTKCEFTKDIRWFYKTGTGAPQSSCMDCVRARNLRHYRYVVKPRTLEKRRANTEAYYGNRTSTNV